MKTTNGTWDSVKAGYLGQVEKALASVGHREKKQVLEDVQSHLDQRFSELGPDEQTWENFQQIITEMGPASDYAELLAADIQTTPRRGGRKFLVTVGVIASFIFILLLSLPFVFKTIKEADFEIDRIKSSDRIVDKIDFPFVDDQRELIGSTGPPTVASTTPVAFDNDVSPNLKEITVTFDQPMMNLSWSWVGGGQTFPEMMGQPQYDKSKRTCTLPVELEAGRFYWIGINSPQHKNFQTDTGVAAVPYVILFATRDENGDPTQIPENLLEEAQSINSAHGELIAVDSAIQWLELIDNGNFGTSWEEAAEVFKNAATKQQWEGMAKTVRQPLGKVISRLVMSKMATQTVPGGPDGEYVIIQFKTSFENKADTIETVTPMLDKDGVWRVSGYYIK